MQNSHSDLSKETDHPHVILDGEKHFDKSTTRNSRLVIWGDNEKKYVVFDAIRFLADYWWALVFSTAFSILYAAIGFSWGRMLIQNCVGFVLLVGRHQSTCNNCIITNHGVFYKGSLPYRVSRIIELVGYCLLAIVPTELIYDG